jgi:transcriptional regulator with XRE-family HTH domain
VVSVGAMSNERARTLREVPPQWLKTANEKFEERHKRDGFKKRHLAAALGVSEHRIGRVLRGEVADYELMNAISDYFGMPRVIVGQLTSTLDDVTVNAQADQRDPKGVLVRRNLIRLRELAGYDRAGAADASGLAFETLAKYETGEDKVTLTDLEILAKTYGHEVGHFFDETPPPTTLGPYDDLWRRRRLVEKLDPDVRAELWERNRQAALEIIESAERMRGVKKPKKPDPKRE